MKQYNMKYLPYTIASVVLLTLVSCGAKIEKTDSPVYELNSNVLYQGSIYYNQGSCASCHGTKMKGDGPDGKNVVDLTRALEPQKTHLDYFKSISANPIHAQYQAWTDRGRWAMAHYLYSLSTGIKKGKDSSSIRNQALAKAEQEIKTAYKNQRRWFMGAKPLSDRPGPDSKGLKIDELLKGVSLDKESSMKVPSVDKQKPVSLTRGHHLYQNNCASCHGQYGEGTSASWKLGPTVPCKDRGRQCVAYISASSLKANINKEPHNVAGLNLPSFSSFTGEDWNQINTYLASLQK